MNLAIKVFFNAVQVKPMKTKLFLKYQLSEPKCKLFALKSSDLRGKKTPIKT